MFNNPSTKADSIFNASQKRDAAKEMADRQRAALDAKLAKLRALLLAKQEAEKKLAKEKAEQEAARLKAAKATAPKKRVRRKTDREATSLEAAKARAPKKRARRKAA